MKNTHFLVVMLLWYLPGKAQNESWPQFRGIKGSGVAAETSKPPLSFEKGNVSWELEIQKGVSSPVIWNEKLFITGYSEGDKELKTFCIDRQTGRIIWERSVVPEKIEKVHPISSPAQSSVVTDGNHVIAFFGSCGLICYKMDGTEVWRYSTPFPTSYYGNAPSPVIVDNSLIMSIDFGDDRFLLSLDKNTGTEIWKTKYKKPELDSEGASATPSIINNIIIVNKNMEVAAYSVINGEKLWGFPIFTVANSSPLIIGNKAIFPCWTSFGEEEMRGELPSFNEMVQKYDSDKSNTLVKSELPGSLLYMMRPEARDLEGTSHSVREIFGLIDKNADKEINQNEWETSVKWIKDNFYKLSELIAIDINSKGELTDSSILWRVSGGIPEVPSPICYQDRIYMVKDGGVVTCLDPSDGHILFRERLTAKGPYISSPVAANGVIYFISYNGMLTMLKASDKFEVVGQSNLKDKVLATPAIVGNTIYIRTGNKLLSFNN